MRMPREIVVSADRPARLDLTLPRRGRVEVLVLDPLDDAALEGVRVVLDGNGSELDSVTDVEGTCVFTDVRAGAYQLRVEAPPGYRARTTQQAVTVAAGGEVLVEFELERAGVVRGRVVDEDTGEPLVGVTVRLFNSTGSFVREATTIADGQYEFTNLPEDRYEVEVER